MKCLPSLVNFGALEQLKEKLFFGEIIVFRLTERERDR
jgi:hypothetical protein